MTVYATPAELAAKLKLDSPPADADELLQRATNTVDVMLRGVVYRTDRHGVAAEDHVRDRIRRATLHQAALLHAVDKATAADGPVQWDSVSIGGVSLSGRKVASGVQVLGHPVDADALTELQLLGGPTLHRSW